LRIIEGKIAYFFKYNMPVPSKIHRYFYNVWYTTSCQISWYTYKVFILVDIVILTV